MGAALVGGGIKHGLDQAEAARVQTESNARLRDQRERGDELLAFMLGELGPQLNATGRIAIMEEKGIVVPATTDPVPAGAVGEPDAAP